MRWKSHDLIMIRKGPFLWNDWSNDMTFTVYINNFPGDYIVFVYIYMQYIKRLMISIGNKGRGSWREDPVRRLQWKFTDLFFLFSLQTNKSQQVLYRRNNILHTCSIIIHDAFTFYCCVFPFKSNVDGMIADSGPWLRCHLPLKPWQAMI